MHYTTLTVSGRVRLAVTAADDTTEMVTSFAADTTADTARNIAATLTELTSDLPERAAWLWHQLRDEFDDGPIDWHYTDYDHDWDEHDADATDLDLPRRALGVLAHGAADPNASSFFAENRLHTLLIDQPESVRRAVRDQVAGAWAPYAGPCVIARVYDHKWHDVDGELCLNASLALLRANDPNTFERVCREGDQSNVTVYLLPQHGLQDLSRWDDAADAGYLSVLINTAQLNAWRDAVPAPARG